MNGLNEKSIERLFTKIDILQEALSKTSEKIAVFGEKLSQTNKETVAINENMRKNHTSLRCELSLIKDRICKIESYSKSPSIIGQFITRNKLALSGVMVAIILAIFEAGRILYKMPPPH